MPITAQAFLKDHIRLLSEHYDVFLVANINSEEEIKGLALAGWKKIAIERGISIKKDIKAVKQLKKYFKEMKLRVLNCFVLSMG